MSRRKAHALTRSAACTLVAALLLWVSTGSVASSPAERRSANRPAELAHASAALGAVTIRVAPTSTHVAEQRTFTVDIYLDAGAAAVDSVDCLMTYDPAYLAGRSLTPGATLPQPLGSGQIADGVIAYHQGVRPGDPAVTGSFRLFALEFAAIAPTPATPLAFGIAIVAGAGQGHSVRTRNGAVAIWALTPCLYLPLVVA